MRVRQPRFDAVAGAVGLAGTVAALLLPWAGYGSSGFAVHRFPDWGWYLALVSTLHAYAGWILVADARTAAPGRPRPGARVVGPLLGAGALAATIALMSRYDDSEAFYGPIVPMVRPFLGPGGPLAVLGILITVVAIHLATRPRPVLPAGVPTGDASDQDTGRRDAVGRAATAPHPAGRDTARRDVAGRE